MRIDQVLHWLCLIKSRSLAGRGCREGWILVNGETVRPSKEVRAGDRITIQGPVVHRTQVVRLREIPEGQLSRKEAPEHYDRMTDAG